jgi:uncharacterized protein (TIGR00661 family)
MMKILYGVQGTGNGHITRARAMARELYAAGLEVNFLFSGRPADKYFDMDVFNDYQLREGLTFDSSKGQVSYLKTAMHANPVQFVKDVCQFDLSAYDLIISDFEPISAWAGKQQNKQVIGIGHQYAFNHDIPRRGDNLVASQIMKHFAPASVGIGLHWHHFGQAVLPPIIEIPETAHSVQADKIIVYLPFEDSDEIMQLFSKFKDFRFHIYSPNVIESRYSNVLFKALSRTGFQQDLHNSAGIISNAGFELTSESLHVGKKILLKPLHGQMEQQSNAAALEHLGYGQTMMTLDPRKIGAWLHRSEAVRVTWPNVAKILVEWLQQGMPEIDKRFIQSVWAMVDASRIDLNCQETEILTSHYRNIYSLG